MVDKKVERSRGPPTSGWGKKERRNNVQRLERKTLLENPVSNLTASGSGFLSLGLENGKDYHGIGDVPEAGFRWETWNRDQECFLAVNC